MDVNHMDEQQKSEHPLVRMYIAATWVVEFVPQEMVTEKHLYMSLVDQQHIRQLIQRYGDDYEVEVGR